MKRVALITCTVLPEPDPDQEIQLQALRSRGLQADTLAWDDAGARPGDFDLCVMRSCWNYYLDPDAFLAFVARVTRDSRLLNSEAVVRWNIHKSYLVRLREAGVPVIPTVFFEHGRPVDVASTMEENDWEDVVIKPSISAASYRTRRFTRGDARAAQAYLESLLRDGDAMIQRYMEGFSTSGERALIWIDGQFTHKVIKTPRFHGQDEKVSDALPVGAEERALGERALSCVADDLAYARVDVVEHQDGLVISEFELMEPSLFFAQNPDALSRFVDAIERRLIT
jgi:glutathione synthase/RimK-type ligase-like ATP-grasp enzyme